MKYLPELSLHKINLFLSPKDFYSLRTVMPADEAGYWSNSKRDIIYDGIMADNKSSVLCAKNLNKKYQDYHFIQALVKSRIWILEDMYQIFNNIPDLMNMFLIWILRTRNVKLYKQFGKSLHKTIKNWSANLLADYMSVTPGHNVQILFEHVNYNEDLKSGSLIIKHYVNIVSTSDLILQAFFERSNDIKLNPCYIFENKHAFVKLNKLKLSVPFVNSIYNNNIKFNIKFIRFILDDAVPFTREIYLIYKKDTKALFDAMFDDYKTPCHVQYLKKFSNIAKLFNNNQRSVATKIMYNYHEWLWDVCSIHKNALNLISIIKIMNLWKFKPSEYVHRAAISRRPDCMMYLISSGFTPTIKDIRYVSKISDNNMVECMHINMINQNKKLIMIFIVIMIWVIITSMIKISKQTIFYQNKHFHPIYESDLLSS